MLTRQGVVTESTCVETVPTIRFVTTEDGRTMLALTEHEDGLLEIVATPITLVAENPAAAAPIVKGIDGHFLLHPPIFQINVEAVGGTSFQRTALLQAQAIDTENSILEDVQPTPVIQADEETSHVFEMLPAPDEDNASGDKENESVPQESALSLAEEQVSKKSPGRPKKIEALLAQGPEGLKCDVCHREFTKQSLYRKHMEHHAEEKPHRCPKCPASFNIPTNFTLHMATHNTGEPKCPECGRKFARMASLKSHMLLHEKEENLFCTECEDAFSTKAQLDAHLKLHGEKWSSEEARKCKLCNKQFTQPALYRFHIREHYRLQTKVTKQTKRGTKHKTLYKCTICLKSFQKPSQLMRHIRVHTGEKPFKCTICGRAFTQKSSLQTHTWQHNGIRPHTCNFCNATFSQKGNLNAHILRVHNVPEGTSMYACTYCSCIFKKLGSLNGHIKRMHANAAEEITIESSEPVTEDDMRATVDSVISQLASLESTANDTTNLVSNTNNNTARSETNDSITNNRDDILQQALKNSGLPSKNKTSNDDVCIGKKIDARTSFVTLLDRSSDGGVGKYLTIKQRCIGNVRWYACSYCHKEFKKPSDLIRHLRVHTQEKPFKCSHCVRSFALKSTMIAHERTHTGTKKYACISCEKMFACHGSLVAHTRVQHGKSDESSENIVESVDNTGRNQSKAQSKGKPKLSAEAESLVPQVVLQEPLVISDTGNRICVSQATSKQKQAYNGMPDLARPHKCWVCYAAFRKISHLKQHCRRHTGERPYKCTKCDRRFTSNSVLKSHLHTHDESRPYSCSVCNTKFSTQSSMKRHLVTHSNRRPYMCPYCHKTFKTYVNCRKHMKIHKHELAQRQLEQQKAEEQSSKSLPTIVANEQAITLSIDEKGNVLSENLTLSDGVGLSFQPQIEQDFAQTLSEQLENMTDEKEKPILSADSVTSSINDQTLQTVESPSAESSQMLHADETGTVTLRAYSGDQTLTPESIREIEETLNQQLFNIGMNFGLGNNLSKQIDDSSATELDSAREPPTLSVIYDNSKGIDTAGNNVFTPQFDTFDMSQITLQPEVEIDIGLVDTPTSTSMASILPKSAKEEERLLTTSSVISNVETAATALCAEQDPHGSLPFEEPCIEYPKISQTQNLTSESRIIICCDAESDTSSLRNDLQTVSLPKSPSSIPQINPTEFAANYAEDIRNSISESLLQCHMCSEKGFTAAGLTEHLKTHRGTKEFQCSECSLRFCTNGGLSRHSKMHATKQQWRCTVCQKVVGSKSQLKLHSRIHDTTWMISPGDGTIQSNVVVSGLNETGAATSINTMNIESDSSISEKVLLDTVAEKEVIDRLDVTLEKKEQKEYTNKCKYCPKTFRKPSDLIRHIRTHTGERPYKCDYCSKSFAVKCTLDSHTKVHTGKKTFRCHVCSSLFATKGSLKVHMRLHTGSKPFRCPICDLRFRTSGHRKVHLLKHTREHKGGNAKRKQKHMKVAAIAEVAAALERNEVSLEKVESSQERQEIENVNAAEYTGLPEVIGIDGGLTDQITFNADSTILNNNSVFSINENNQIVANLHFLLANGLVTIQTEDTPMISQTNEPRAIMPNDTMSLAVNVDSLECGVPDETIENNTAPTTTMTQTTTLLNSCFVDVPKPPVAKPERSTNKQNNRTTASKKECDICGKTFMKPYQVERHKRIHTGERPYKCDLCTKSFAQKSTLQMHQKHHTGDRPHPCPHCEYSFTQKGNLRTHVKRVHQLDTLDIKKFRRSRQAFAAKSIQNPIPEAKILTFDDISFVEFLK